MLESVIGWFRGSQVVGSDGRPLVVYHGTGRDFSEYRVGEEGIFFSESPETASFYAEFHGEGGNIRPAILSIKKPLRMTWREWLMGVTDDGLNHYLEGNEGLARRGYDGVILTDPDLDDPAMSSVTYVVFRPDQVRGLFECLAPGVEQIPSPPARPEERPGLGMSP